MRLGAVVGVSTMKTGRILLNKNIGVWPAWWTLGGGTWPLVSDGARGQNIMLDVWTRQTGEIDIIEGVHDNAHNQVTWHTGPSRL